MFRNSACSLAMFFFTASLAIAEAPKDAPHYLSPTAINVVDLLPDPPAPDSPEHQEELNLLLKLQQERTPADVARASNEENHLSIFSFADVLGPNFTPERCPKTAAFFKSALQADLGYFNKLAKSHWNRPRPYTDPRIHSLFVEKDGSYPSGHSIRATLFAEVLASVIPQHREGLIALTADGMGSRNPGRPLSVRHLRRPRAREGAGQGAPGESRNSRAARSASTRA